MHFSSLLFINSVKEHIKEIIPLQTGVGLNLFLFSENAIYSATT